MSVQNYVCDGLLRDLALTLCAPLVWKQTFINLNWFNRRVENQPN